MQIQGQHQKVYLDTCCLSRPFDDVTQERVGSEIDALMTIGRCFLTGQLHWVSSKVLVTEVRNNPNESQRRQIITRLNSAHESVLLGEPENVRAAQLELLGFQLFDALHIACAESAGADVLLTTDDKMLTRAKRQSEHLRVRVENPSIWLQEITGAGTVAI